MKGRLTWLTIGATAAMLALTGAASAIPLTLTGPIAGNTVGPQSTSNPCIIAGTACSQPAGFGFNNFPNDGNETAFNAYSTSVANGNNGTEVANGVQGTPYTVSQIDGITNNLPFNVAIDVNTSGGAGGHLETLQLFEVIVNGLVAYQYLGNGCTTSGNTVTPVATCGTLIGNISNNGNGFGDWTLGVIDLSSFADTATVLFHAVWNKASDGAESFFIVAVPGPLAGAGLPGLVMACGGLIAFARRRRKLVV